MSNAAPRQAGCIGAGGSARCKDESPAVRRLIASHGPLPVQKAASAAFGFSPSALEESRSPNPEILDWVLALWTERLVGGEPPRSAEPPVILALSCLSPPLLYRLCHAIGQARIALLGDPQGVLSIRPSWQTEREWYKDWFLQQIQAEETPLESWALKDIPGGRSEQGLDPRRRLATLGLTSIARLLTEPEPHRVRWALQHVPYQVAKRVRSIMAQQIGLTTGHLELESMLLRASWERLAQRRSDMARDLEKALRKAEGWDVD